MEMAFSFDLAQLKNGRAANAKTNPNFIVFIVFPLNAQYPFRLQNQFICNTRCTTDANSTDLCLGCILANSDCRRKVNPSFFSAGYSTVIGTLPTFLITAEP